MKKRKPTNPILVNLIEELSSKGYKDKNKFLLALAKRFKKPSNNRPEVNLSRINRNTKDGDTIVVPGKILSSGILEKKLTIACFKSSLKAEEKIKESGSNILTIKELIEKNPKGSNVKIIC